MWGEGAKGGRKMKTPTLVAVPRRVSNGGNDKGNTNLQVEKKKTKNARQWQTKTECK